MDRKTFANLVLRAVDNDKHRLKILAEACKTIGIGLGDNVNGLIEEENGKVTFTPELVTLITYSDMGILGKLSEIIGTIKSRTEQGN